ncbi:GntR family transcriptional regulator [Nocardioides sp. TF02-7]|uniref:GntR family transcriptional regulator n=1 Tax=Nocardioides sp. TF02-7 TaxID=2917724 RepID=UPI001F059C82|nr:GntR family transcriptional regulator [Nocardioides sp. TF02-7]UMG94531.1 GntR family transcriptional regulator [Nocardioides sp. TF02-7]
MTSRRPFASLSVEQASTVERVTAELRRAVFEGEVESGTPLREVALAESLGVSRPTVREALMALVAEGLAVREPYRGVSVVTPRAESVRDVCVARWVLEGAGVQAWRTATDDRRKRVRTTLEAYTAAVRSGRASYEELNERHLAFHVSLVELTGSPRLVHMAESLMDELKLALAQVDRVRRNAHDQAESHERLVQLLEGDDLEPAYEFLPPPHRRRRRRDRRGARAHLTSPDPGRLSPWSRSSPAGRSPASRSPSPPSCSTASASTGRRRVRPSWRRSCCRSSAWR